MINVPLARRAEALKMPWGTVRKGKSVPKTIKKSCSPGEFYGTLSTTAGTGCTVVACFPARTITLRHWKERVPLEYILQFARILGFCLAGEALHHFLPLPIPASIYGLILLFLALETGFVKLGQVKAASAWLIAVFPIMFVPGTVGAMELLEVMASLLVPILLAVFLVTAIVFVVTGHVTQSLLFAFGYAAQSHKQKKEGRKS